jgi:GNAT superfamily N-acetyltransferase
MRRNASPATDARAWTLHLPGGQLASVRHIGPADADSLQAYVRALSREARRTRFLGALNELAPTELDRLTRAGRREQVTLLAEICSCGDCHIVSEAPYAIASDAVTCEFALSVADAWQRRSIGTQMLRILERQVASLGVRYLVADAYRSNQAVKDLAQKLGFIVSLNTNDTRLMRLRKTIAVDA